MDGINVLRCGVVDYQIMARSMKGLQKKRIAGEIDDTIIFVQHPEVVTIGPKAVRDNVIVEGYPTSLTDRGGGITWHGPGQLVVYPIVKWRVEEQSIRGVIGKLEDWSISALAECGIVAYKDESMQGAWVDGYKICSIGLSFLHWVSRHGMSINIDTPANRVEDLECCGIAAGTHTSLSRLGYTKDKNGFTIDCERLERSLIQTCEESLGRIPFDPVEWSPEIAV
ncbi:MAG TPA: lipoyl(octanoyl) transferase LipB [Candidatus Thalassarchaeaceae archaeon]|jgi:lipoate-protein ligase B|nr:lipoyl(octanoyl) transferase LipB [Candidatus Thalassarchaeaceae archaeon]